MTPQQLATAVNNATDSQVADFNDNSEYKLYKKNGPGNTSGVEWASTHDGFTQEQKNDFAELINQGIKDPC